MTLPSRSPGLALHTGLAALCLFLQGCHNEASSPDAQAAQKAIGITPETGAKKNEEVTRDVTVVKDVKVIDNTTHQVLSETKESTPFKIQEVKKQSVDVKVNAGDTTRSTTGSVPIPAPK